MRLHCSPMPNIMAFKTLDGDGFLEFGLSNAKYLVFDTLDENALRALAIVVVIVVYCSEYIILL